MLNFINDIEHIFPIGIAIKQRKIKNDATITTYRQISMKNIP